MKMQNLEIRFLMTEKNIAYRELAKTIGVAPETLSRLMAKPLSPRNYNRVLDGIQMICALRRVEEK